MLNSSNHIDNCQCMRTNSTKPLETQGIDIDCRIDWQSARPNVPIPLRNSKITFALE